MLALLLNNEFLIKCGFNDNNNYYLLRPALLSHITSSNTQNSPAE